MSLNQIFTPLLFCLFSFSLFSCELSHRVDNHTALADSILEVVSEPEIPPFNVNISSLGAIPGGNEDSRNEILEAIGMCRDNGGGIITIPPGKFLVKGPLHLESKTGLHLQEGAELIFGGDFEDYLPAVKTRWEGIILYNYSPFIYANGEEDIAITGKGIINGNSKDTWNTWSKLQDEDKALARKMNREGVPVNERIFGEGHYLRTPMIQFYECRNILVEGVTIKDSPFWCIHPVFSKNIIVRNVVFSAHNYNNDGIDPDSSEDILIEGVKFDNRDDNIAIKSGRDNEGRELGIPSRNILVRNCAFKGHNAICVGSEMSGNVYNVVVEDCVSRGSVRAGFYLKSNNDRGGEIYEIYARNLSFDSCRYLIEFDTDYKGQGKGFPSSFHDVYISGLKALYASDYGISIQGTEEKPVNHVLIDKIAIKEAMGDYRISNAYALNFNDVQINGKKFDLKVGNFSGN